MAPLVREAQGVTDEAAPVYQNAGGSADDALNCRSINQTAATLPGAGAEPLLAAVSALSALNPQDGFEGMIASQLVAAHNSAMTCFAKAVNAQGPDCLAYLAEGNKLARTFATLVQARATYRGEVR
ncbi:MAG: hypothetical protein Q7J32_17545 [Sphingomonadaceae bacterium]|nr:hypothetical protein [Sphingomonadaceae bacterium]